jgi:hypothetical protein
LASYINLNIYYFSSDDRFSLEKEEILKRYRDPVLCRTIKSVKELPKSGDTDKLKKLIIPINYKEHFLIKLPHLEEFFSVKENDPKYRLLKVWPVSSNLALTHLLGKTYTKIEKPSCMIHFMPESATPQRKLGALRPRNYHSHTLPIHLVLLLLFFMINIFTIFYYDD